jgi:hypothetical protein
VKFEWAAAADVLDGELVYSEQDYAIDFELTSYAQLRERVGSQGYAPLAFSTLTIEVGIESNKLLFPHGYFPKMRWQTGLLESPLLKKGVVWLVSGPEMFVGIAQTVRGSETWPIVWDEISGWIRFGENTVPSNAEAIEYAKGAGIVLSEGRVLSLWFRPKIVD